jgi:hypothetical protein
VGQRPAAIKMFRLREGKIERQSSSLHQPFRYQSKYQAGGYFSMEVYILYSSERSCLRLWKIYPGFCSYLSSTFFRISTYLPGKTHIEIT